MLQYKFSIYIYIISSSKTNKNNPKTRHHVRITTNNPNNKILHQLNRTTLTLKIKVLQKLISAKILEIFLRKISIKGFLS